MGWLDKTHVFGQMTDAGRIGLMLENVPVGRSESGEVLFVPEKERFSGTYIIGRQGRGKSAMAEGMIESDVQAVPERAVMVIDPHKDLVDNIVAWLPGHRVKDTYMLNMEDEGWPFGLNIFSHGPLDTEREKTRVINRIEHVFHMLWPETADQVTPGTFVRMCTIALLTYPGATMLDMQRMLLEPAFRADVLSRSDASTQKWWHYNYDVLGELRQRTVVGPVLRRLDILFTGRTFLSNIIGQPQSTISFRKAIEERKVILIKLPTEGMEQEAQLVGKLITAQLSQAVFSFGDTPVEARPGVSVYVDEFALFAVPDFAKIFSEGRKFGMKITLIHQYRAQLEPYLQAATATAQVKIAFGLEADSARDMAPYFPQPSTIEPDDEVVEHLRKRGTDYPEEVRIFAHEYLLPLKHHVKGSEVHLGSKLAYDLFDGFYETEHTEDDPTALLNSLLYRCMQERSAHFDIPYPVAMGFSTVGNYEMALSKRRRHNPRLEVGYKLPDWNWHRKMIRHDARLLRFVYYLRATMAYLAEHPIGKRVTVSQADVAARLVALPPRMAYVRADEQIALVRTLDTPPKISGAALRDRLDDILNRTRAEYCHPRAEVEGLTAVTVPQREPELRAIDPAVRLSRWGKVYEP